MHIKCAGSVIKGIQIAVSSMTTGQQIHLTCPPKVAYGKIGAPQLDIQPNSTLNFEVWLVSWKPGSQFGSDGKVFRKILKTGEGIKSPGELDVCKGKPLAIVQPPCAGERIKFSNIKVSPIAVYDLKYQLLVSGWERPFSL